MILPLHLTASAMRGLISLITLEACHAVDVLEEAFKLYGSPEIINTDQGSQFTATIFVDCVEAKGCH